MFEMEKLVKITKALEKKFVGQFWVSFVQGFCDVYVIVEPERDSPCGRQVYKVSELLEKG